MSCIYFCDLNSSYFQAFIQTPHTQNFRNYIICVGLTDSYLCLHRLV